MRTVEFSRSEIKRIGGQTAIKNYFYLVTLFLTQHLVTLAFVTNGAYYTLEPPAIDSYYISLFEIVYRTWPAGSIEAYARFLGNLETFRLFLILFAGSPLIFGIANCCVELVKDRRDQMDVFWGFKYVYIKLLGLNVVKYALIVLGALLFVVPGIILSYRYYFTDYILYEHPEYSVTEVLKASAQMTDGNKWNLFLFDFSFFFWYLLGGFVSILFFGLGAVLINPYINASRARLYLEFNGYFEERMKKEEEYVQPSSLEEPVTIVPEEPSAEENSGSEQ